MSLSRLIIFATLRQKVRKSFAHDLRTRDRCDLSKIKVHIILWGKPVIDHVAALEGDAIAVIIRLTVPKIEHIVKIISFISSFKHII